MPKTSVTLEQDVFDRWKASGVGLAELITRGLNVGEVQALHRMTNDEADEHMQVDAAEQARQKDRDARTDLLDKLGRRIENLCASNERLVTVLDRVATPGEKTELLTLAVDGLLQLLTERYTLQPPAEKVVVLGPHEHTAEGPEQCPRCQLLRDTGFGQGGELRSDRPTPLYGSAAGGNSATSPGGGGGNGSGDVGGYSVGSSSGMAGGGGAGHIMASGGAAFAGGGRYGPGMLGAWPPPGGKLGGQPAHGAYLGDAELQDPSDEPRGGNDPDAQLGTEYNLQDH
jgi:hypothetical protein